ncbi:hypothetical protein BH20ACT4_BH20ACT4_14160 [soil metagenome]
MTPPLLVADARRVLSGSPTERPVEPSFHGARIAAVLIALADGPRGAEVLLTRRSMIVSSHRGQVAFPGGRVDTDETVAEAALREAYEEVGLDPALVEPFAELSHLNTEVSRSYIVPVVAQLGELPALAPTSAEVDRVFWAPLADFVRPGAHRSERWAVGEHVRDVHFYDVAGENVWGATAAVLTELLDLLLGLLPGAVQARRWSMLAADGKVP